MDAGQLVILVTAATGVITTIVGLFFQTYRENRNRRWDLEDRNNARKELENKQETLVRKIDENTEMSKKAFDEANNFNRKWAAIDELFKAVKIKEHIAELADLQEIKSVGEDTNERVREIQETPKR